MLTMPAPRRTQLVLAAALGFAAAGSAQDDEPGPRAVTLRFELDGEPIPGVPIRAAAAASWRPHDGWLRADEPRLARAAWPVVGRSDPEGRWTVATNRGHVDWNVLDVGAPFRVLEREPTDDGWRVLVARHEHFVVRVCLADGAPLPRMPMVLRQAGRDVCHAVTDAAGMATFGVDASLAARCTVLPFGWIGPDDGMPTVAVQLPDKILDVRLPPFGFVRARVLVGGVPGAARGLEASVRRGARSQSVARSPHEHVGVEFGPVAVGTAVEGLVRFASGEVAAFAARAVGAPGEVVVVDVEAEPPRPKLTLRIVAPGLRAPRSDLRVTGTFTLVTDGATVPVVVEVGGEGPVLLDPRPSLLRGARLRRVDVDIVETGSVRDPERPHARPRRAWSGSLAVERDLTPITHDLGVAELVPRGAVLRGRVVDEAGGGVADVQVEVAAAGAPERTVSTRTERGGAFELWQPLLRCGLGAPAPLVAVAVRGSGGERQFGPPGAPQPPGSEVTLVLPTPGRGHVALAFARGSVVPMAALEFAYVDARGGVHGLADWQQHWQCDAATDGVPHCRLGSLPAGWITLRILLRPGVPLLEVPDVVVPAGGDQHTDARLRQIDLTPLVRRVRVRVVDEQEVPIAGAHGERRGASDAFTFGPSDAGGWLEVVLPTTGGSRIGVAARGRQPVVVERVVDGQVVRLRRLPSLCVQVRGLPDDLPRAGLAVFLRSASRENLADHAAGELGAGDTASVPLPPPGRYHVRLTRQRTGDGGTTWGQLAQRDVDVWIGRDADSVEFVLDAPAVQRVREALAK
jgi:hypothetical protein